MPNTESAKLGFVADLPEGAGVPSEFQIFPYGEIQIEGAAPFTVDEAGMEQAVRRFEERGLDMVIDYEHQTEGGEQAPAAGWIKRLENRGKDGLWAVADWTGRALQYLANREYRYFSPVFLISGAERRLSELLRVALTNAPRLNWIRPIVAKGQAPGAGGFQSGDEGAGDGPGRDSGENRSRNPELFSKRVEIQQESQMEFLKIVAKQLGLSETASPDEVSGAVGKLVTLREGTEALASTEVLGALDLPEGSGKSEVVAAIHVLKTSVSRDRELAGVVASLEGRLAARDRADLVAAAIREGRITPAQKGWAEKYAAEDPEGFRLFAAKAPRIVPLDLIRPARDRASGSGAPDADQARINRLVGIDEETWKKYGLETSN